MNSLQPLADWIVVRKLSEPETSPGGIHLPDSGRAQRMSRGVVLAIGDGRLENGEKVPIRVQEHDEILYPTMVGTTVTLDGQELVLMRDSEVPATVIQETAASRSNR